MKLDFISKIIRSISDYIRHFIDNIKVSAKCLVLSLFHLLHGLLPIRQTSHEYWEAFIKKRVLKKRGLIKLNAFCPDCGSSETYTINNYQIDNDILGEPPNAYCDNCKIEWWE